MYSDSKIFKATFTCKDDGNDQYRNRLTESLANFRERVGVLIDGTPKDVPGLTVHDLTHMDALWDMLDILTGGDYRLNPAEAYVLGGAILLHDSAMTISIYPNGVNELKETAEYIDAYAYFEDNSHLAKEDDGYLIAAQGYAISDTLRLKHAENAETLATQKWDSKVSDGAFYLIDDSELREHYAHSIGRVAHSHHWDVDKAVSELSHCKGAFTGFPADWNVNEIKLALILRCIDAMHLDDRRAPTFTSALRTINEESAIHWKFQSKLAQPTLVSRKIQYTSKSPFTIEEASAWNLCFDTIQMVDLELRNASDIQERLSIQRFEAQGVVGSGSPGALAQHIQVKDWTPIPLNLQVSDVPSLALTLGGTDLYDFPLTPIREMIQNSADAIEARAVLDEDFDVGDGKIVIKLMEVEGKGHVLEITDNGVGMSERILTKVLLDFGMSFWKSKAARSEFPGLQKHTNKFRGRYGIGFFSIFMWSNDIRVSSRKFDDGVSSARTLDFSDGMHSRPILRSAFKDERSTRWNTKIELILNEKALDYLKGDSKFIVRKLKNLCGPLPIEVEFQCGSSFKESVSLPKWKTCTSDEFFDFFEKIAFPEITHGKYFKDTLTQIVKDGEVVGRCFIAPYHSNQSSRLPVYEKGIYVNRTNNHEFFGVFEASTTNAARDRASDISFSNYMESLTCIRDKAFSLSKNLGESTYLQNLFLRYKLQSDDVPLLVINREILSFNDVIKVIETEGKFSIELLCEENFDEKYEVAWKQKDALSSLASLHVDVNKLYPLVCESNSYSTMDGFKSLYLNDMPDETTLINEIENEFQLPGGETFLHAINRLCNSCKQTFVLSEHSVVEADFGERKVVLTFTVEG